MQIQFPVIPLTNDDGIQSDGPWAAAGALLPLLREPLQVAAA